MFNTSGELLRIGQFATSTGTALTVTSATVRTVPEPGTLALAVMAVLVVLIGFTIHSFLHLRRAAAWLMLPYLAWKLFAAYLNAGFWWLNPI